MRYADKKYKEKSYTVYMHKCPNNKIYVGLTCQSPYGRWNDGKGYKHQQLFYRAINKYGWENIEHIIVKDRLSLDEASTLEKELIAKYKANNIEYGYNLTSGGEGISGYHLTEEQLERHRQNSLGRKHTQATKDKISRLNKGRKLNLTDEQRAACAERARLLGLRNRGKVRTEQELQHISDGVRSARENGKVFGHNKPHSEATKRKISAIQRGRKLSDDWKKHMSESQKLRWQRIHQEQSNNINKLF